MERALLPAAFDSLSQNPIQKEKATAIRGFVLNLGIKGSGLFGMLIFVDAFAHAVLTLVEMFLLSLGQMTIVSGHVFLFLMLNALFAFFQTRSLSGRELATLDAVGYALLLIRFAAVNFVHARMTRIDLSRTGLRLSRGGANKHQAPHCQN